MERLHMQGAGQIGELVPHRERSATQRILGNNLAPCALRLAPCALRPAPRDQDGIAARLPREGQGQRFAPIFSERQPHADLHRNLQTINSHRLYRHGQA